VPEGGLVPKSLYITSSDEDVDKDRSDEALLGPEAIYHTAYAVRDFPHEVQLMLCFRTVELLLLPISFFSLPVYSVCMLHQQYLETSVQSAMLVIDEWHSVMSCREPESIQHNTTVVNSLKPVLLLLVQLSVNYYLSSVFCDLDC